MKTSEQKAFLAGFAISGEGHNGEYPFAGDKERMWRNIEPYFKEYLLINEK